MKKILIILLVLVFFGSLFLLNLNSADAVWVNGYYRSNGTYVNGYERTAPDGNPYNNYGYPGNYNPNTGKITGGNPDTYLDNYYNNSSGSTYYPSYSYPTTPTCPINSYYDGISSCKCNYGYIVSGGSCVSGNSVCYSQLGYSSSYDSLSNKCKCNYGYVIGTKGQCISTSSYCSNQLGLMSQYNSLSNKCECMTGYEFDGSSCVYKKTNYSYPSGYTASLVSCRINLILIKTGANLFILPQHQRHLIVLVRRHHLLALLLVYPQLLIQDIILMDYITTTRKTARQSIFHHRLQLQIAIHPLFIVDRFLMARVTIMIVIVQSHTT